jgi:Domain of unknown function (DUF3331)
MNSNIAKSDPWPKIVDLLSGCGACGSAGTRPVLTRESIIAAGSRRDRTMKSQSPALPITPFSWACATIKVLEVTESSASICWYDSTLCRYEDQRWRRLKTQRAGICAMSGAMIAMGDDVFHPVPRNIAANADAMILTLVLRRAAAQSVTGAE